MNISNNIYITRIRNILIEEYPSIFFFGSWVLANELADQTAKSVELSPIYNCPNLDPSDINNSIYFQGKQQKSHIQQCCFIV